jgi:endogenous inhibitor of DNA gyrase (YacG/DUF329 family)
LPLRGCAIIGNHAGDSLRDDRAVKIKCPICHKTTTWEENPNRPFCSKRCRLIDLGKWASGEYRIEGREPASGEGEGEQGREAGKEQGREKDGDEKDG